MTLIENILRIGRLYQNFILKLMLIINAVNRKETHRRIQGGLRGLKPPLHFFRYVF